MCPQWVLDCHNGMCMNCAIRLGPHKMGNDDDCCVCLEHKIMVVLKCNHKICNDCWCQITCVDEDEDENKNLCPLCRNVNGRESYKKEIDLD